MSGCTDPTTRHPFYPRAFGRPVAGPASSAARELDCDAPESSGWLVRHGWCSPQGRAVLDRLFDLRRGADELCASW